MPASPTATPEHIKDVNTRYHDAAADSYDAKWGIDFGETGQHQVALKLKKALGEMPETLGDTLEIGAGTGYFSLNLASQGLIGSLTATDISPGMLSSLSRTAKNLEFPVETVVTEAEVLPFEDESFDTVIGHAVLHHIPDLDKAFSEFFRVLRPGGRIVFCGEPSRYGDRLAAVPKRTGTLIAPVWRRLVGAETLEHTEEEMADDEHSLEPEVDVHAFVPADLRAIPPRSGFVDTEVNGEELVSNVWGWGMRSLESTATPDTIPHRWRNFAFRSYIAFQKVDNNILEPHLPAELFYNLLLSARKPS
ncbi:MAG: class I SAM-dependent methyltransferase [Solirubrobacterales bacterium]|nr:class I SAM-dependent methyltransferase [Solirubrobacterales bacterium]HMT04638.1 class I SAM-dependent methyltransferase [Solirubrobacterales bacterium]